MRRGKPKKAIAVFQRVLEHHPADPIANAAMGELMVAEKQFSAAKTYLAYACTFDQDNPSLLNNLGYAHVLDGTPDEGIVFLLRADELLPDTAAIKLNIARSYDRQGLSELALPFCREAFELVPEDATVRQLLAHLLGANGHFEEAIEHYQYLVSCGIRVARNIQAIVLLRKQTPQDNLLPTIEENLQSAQSKGDLNNLHFAAGKTHLDLGNYAEGLSHIISAKVARGEKFKRAGVLRNLEKSTEVFTQSYLKEREHFGSSSERPVFIIGMPRSGSTLTEQILNGHPAIAGAGERNLFSDVLTALGHNLGNDLFVQQMLNLKEVDVRGFSSRYLRAIAAFGPDKRYIANKFLHNFLAMPLISLLFPNATFIYCKRDPMDCCLSIFTNPLDWGHKYSLRLDDLGWYFRFHEHVVRHWRSIIPNRIIDIQYEDTVQNLRGTVERVLSELDLEWHDDCASFHERTRSVQTCSKWQVRQPLYSSSVGRHKLFGEALAPLADALAKYEDSFQKHLG